MALVVVLWVTTLLTLIAASFSLSMRRESQLVRNQLEAVQARYLAEAGVQHAILQLLHTDPEQRWEADGAYHELELEGAKLTISVADESGKVDINTASDVLLDGLLAAAGAEEARRQSLVAAILDWRDPSEGHRLNGADAAAYEAAGLDYGPRNDNFQSIEELQLVLGMSGDLYRRLAPDLTVFSHQSGINPAFASPQVLQALPGVEGALAETYLEQRDRHRQEGLEVPDFPMDSPHVVSGGGIAYSIASSAHLPGGADAYVEAVVMMGRGRTGEPVTHLLWRLSGRDPNNARINED